MKYLIVLAFWATLAIALPPITTEAAPCPEPQTTEASSEAKSTEAATESPGDPKSESCISKIFEQSKNTIGKVISKGGSIAGKVIRQGGSIAGKVIRTGGSIAKRTIECPFKLGGNIFAYLKSKINICGWFSGSTPLEGKGNGN